MVSKKNNKENDEKEKPVKKDRILFKSVIKELIK